MTLRRFSLPELNSSCYLSLVLVCSSFENRSLVAATVRSLVAKKKTLSRPHSQFFSSSALAVTCFEVYAYTSRFQPCDMRTRSAETKTLHRMNGSINLYLILIIADKKTLVESVVFY